MGNKKQGRNRSQVNVIRIIRLPVKNGKRPNRHIAKHKDKTTRSEHEEGREERWKMRVQKQKEEAQRERNMPEITNSVQELKLN